MSFICLWTGADAKVVRKIVDPIKPSLPGGGFPAMLPLNEVVHQPPPGGVIMAMGSKALAVLQNAKLAPKGRTVTFMREKPIPYQGGHFLVTNDPYAQNSDPAVVELIQWDLQLASRLVRTGTTEPEIGKYAYVDGFSDIRTYVEAMYARNKAAIPVTLDLETMGLFPWYPEKKIVTVQISVAEGHSDVAYVLDMKDNQLKALISDLDWILNTPMIKLRGANLKFDLTWLKVRWGLECSNFTMDTTLVGSLLNENRSNSLEMHAKLFTPMGGYDAKMKAHDKGKMELVPKEDMLVYAGGDTDACLRASNVMVRDLSADGEVARFYTKVLHPAVRAFEKIEERGLPVNPKKMSALSDELAGEIVRLEAEALAMFPARLRIKHMNSLSLSKPSVLKDFFFTPLGLNLKPKLVTEKTQEPSTAKDHLMMFEDVPEAKAFVKVFSAWAQASKTKSTFVDGFMKHFRPDGLFHPTYFLFAGQEGDMEGGTVTGRLTCKDPPMQVLPKHTVWAKKIRECFEAPPGYVMWEIDFDQGELKITADVANDTNMLEAYLSGQDLHIKTGGALAGYEYAEMLHMRDLGDPELGGDPNHALYKLFKATRQKAKAANFGLIYRISEEGYRAFARTTYGVILTKEEAAQHFMQFFGLYDRLHPWHEEYVNRARQYGWVRSPMGRVRHLPLINSKDSKARGTAERQAINSPIQGCLSDMGLYAIGILAKQYPQLWVAGMTHDALYGYCPEDDVEEWCRRIAGVMSNLPLEELDWHPKLQFTASAEAGPNWAAMHAIAV